MSFPEDQSKWEAYYIGLLETAEFAYAGYKSKIEQNRTKMASLCVPKKIEEPTPDKPDPWYLLENSGEEFIRLIAMSILSVLLWILPLYRNGWDALLIILKILVGVVICILLKYFWDSLQDYLDDTKESRGKWREYSAECRQEQVRLNKENGQKQQLEWENTRYDQQMKKIKGTLNALYKGYLIPRHYYESTDDSTRQKCIAVLAKNLKPPYLSLSKLVEPDMYYDVQNALKYFNEYKLNDYVTHGTPYAVDRIERSGESFWSDCHEAPAKMEQYMHISQAKSPGTTIGTIYGNPQIIDQNIGIATQKN